MTSDLDIYRSAQVLIREHGDNTAPRVAKRADAMLEMSKVESAAVWQLSARSKVHRLRIEVMSALGQKRTSSTLAIYVPFRGQSGPQSQISRPCNAMQDICRLGGSLFTPLQLPISMTAVTRSLMS